MADPHWSSYVGMATGIAGFALAVIAYRRTNRLTEMELRLSLRKSASKAVADLAALEEMLPHASKSRLAVASAMGTLRSGAMELWKQSLETDQGKLAELFASAPSATDDFSALDLKELESKSADIYKLQLAIDELNEKYRSALAEDEAERGRLRDFMNRARS